MTSNPNRLISKVLYPGDVFVFPIGLIHFQFNIVKTNGVAFAGLSSQNPGVITIANATFGSNPPINPDILAKAFQMNKNVVNYLIKQFGGSTKSGGMHKAIVNPLASLVMYFNVCDEWNKL